MTVGLVPPTDAARAVIEDLHASGWGARRIASELGRLGLDYATRTQVRRIVSGCRSCHQHPPSRRCGCGLCRGCCPTECDPEGCGPCQPPPAPLDLDAWEAEAADLLDAPSPEARP
ncbi:MAG: helix-turn-helix domain-containing protein [Acidobacteria bacterium]|nr:helix-turn-helix domain-containing protein [Acidobacteriota bacterium]